MGIFSDQKPEQFVGIRQIGSGGLDVFNDSQDIKDTAVSDALNVVFDKGYAQPRKGSSLAWDVPTGETNNGLALFAARASDGTNYTIGVYAPNFYFRDEVNNQWVKINSTYTPSSTYKTLMYGYINWNAGIGSDVLYAGNGVEDCIKWQVAAAYVASPALAGATSLVLDDASKFPATGTIVIKEANTAEIFTTYSAKSTNTLTVPALSGAVGAGACVTFQILDATNVQKGNMLMKFNNRLIVTGKKGAESTIFASQSATPETFTPGTSATSPFAEVIADGTGGITGVDSFGEYLLIEKEDSLHKLLIDATTSSDGTTSYLKLTVQPVATDISMGPIQSWAKIKKNNLLYYATKTEGILAINPDITGSQMSIQTSVLSMPIQPFVLGLDMSNSRTTAFNQKILWSATSDATADTIIVYDLNRQIWTRFNNWPVRDWLRHNKKLYFMSRVDNKVYQCFTDAKIDGETPYEARVATKRFDLGQAAVPKTMSKIFVSGFISRNETLKFDVILVTGNQIITIPYELDGGGNLTVLGIPVALAMAMMGIPTLGNVSIDPVSDLLGLFRCYLAIPNRYGFFTVQVIPHSSVEGTDWGFTGIAFSPYTEFRVPENLTIGSVGDVVRNSNTGLVEQENEAFIELNV